ncbi:MAG: hypothetical protein QOE35_522 [Actinomycetota bacterium]|jgi:hypothetical protein
MAYVVDRGDGRYELRQAAGTSRGPRARTLASFRVLNDDVLTHAEERTGGPLDRTAIRRSARRAGAPVAPPPGDERAGALLGVLARGGAPTPVRSHLLAHALAPDAVDPPDHHVRAAGAWVDADAQARGAALRDVLSLVDAIPARRRTAPLRFPRLSSTAS